MFFVGLAGIDGKVDYCGIGKGCACPSCGSQSPLYISKQYNYFHLFFLPVKKFHIHYTAVCPQCASLYELDAQKGSQAEQEGVVAVTRADLTPIGRTGGNNYAQ